MLVERGSRQGYRPPQAALAPATSSRARKPLRREPQPPWGAARPLPHPPPLCSGELGASSGAGLPGHAVELVASTGNPQEPSQRHGQLLPQTLRGACPPNRVPPPSSPGPRADPTGSVPATLPRVEPRLRRRARPRRLLPAATAGKAPSTTVTPGRASGDKDASRHPLTPSSPARHSQTTGSGVCRDVGARAPDPPQSVLELPQGTRTQNPAAPAPLHSPLHTPGPFPPMGEGAAREPPLSPTDTPAVSQPSQSRGCPGSAPALR